MSLRCNQRDQRTIEQASIQIFLYGLNLCGMLVEKILCLQVNGCQGPQAFSPLTKGLRMWVTHCHACYVEKHSQNLCRIVSFERLGHTWQCVSTSPSILSLQWFTAIALCQISHRKPASFLVHLEVHTVFHSKRKSTGRAPPHFLITELETVCLSLRRFLPMLAV